MGVVTVIGTGAIGLTLASELAECGLTPKLLGRSGPKSVSFELKTDLGLRRHQFSAPAEAELRKAEAVLIAVKAFDLEAALSWIERFPDGIPVLPLANGATQGIVARATKAHPKKIWRLGYCTFGVTVMSEGRYALRSKTGRCDFGPFLPCDAEPTAVEREMLKPGALFAWHNDIERLHRRKWLYNTVINTLTAARRLPRNGELLADMPTLTAVFAEAHILAETLWGPWQEPRAALFAGLVQLIESTRDNENSMARDVRLGRRTESDFLAGLAHDPALYPLLTSLHKQVTTD